MEGKQRERLYIYKSLVASFFMRDRIDMDENQNKSRMKVKMLKSKFVETFCLSATSNICNKILAKKMI